jgi:hypothetical protein
MKPRSMLEVDRDAQVVILWQGRRRDQRRAADVEAFRQWLLDYAPWLVSAMPAGGTDPYAPPFPDRRGATTSTGERAARGVQVAVA